MILDIGTSFFEDFAKVPKYMVRINNRKKEKQKLTPTIPTCHVKGTQNSATSSNDHQMPSSVSEKEPCSGGGGG